MSYVPTGAYFFVKRPQYVEESTYGTTPTSPVFTSCGSIQDFTLAADMQSIKYRQLGSRDLYSTIRTGQMFTLTLKYQPFNTNFMKYGTEYWNAGATGNIAKSLSIIWSQNLNGTENFVLAQGCRSESIDIDITENSVMVSQVIIAQNVSSPATTFVGAGGTGTPTYAGADVGTPWVGLSGGQLPLTINALNYDVERFRIAINQNLDKIKPNGETQIKFLEATNRDITIDLDMILKDNVTMADTKTVTARTASYMMNSGTTSSVSLTNLWLDKYNIGFSPTANKAQRVTFTGFAQSATILN